MEIYNEQIADLLCPPPKEEELVILSPKERLKLEDKIKKLLRKEDSDPVELNKLRAKLDPSFAKKENESNLPKVLLI